MKVPEILKNRFILEMLFLFLSFGLHKYFTGYYLPTTDTKDLWFYSGMFMVLFSILFIEPYYTSPKNVITNVIPLVLVFLSVKSSFSETTLWHISFWSLLLLLCLSLIVLALTDVDQSPTHIKNRIANFIKDTVLIFGRGKFLYSLVFFIFLYLNVVSIPAEQFHKIFSGYFVVLITLWGMILSIDPEKLNSAFSVKRKKNDEDEIGEIFGIQSKRIFLVKAHKDKKGVKKFDVVKFRYSMQTSDNFITGIIFDTYLLDQEKWLKILQLGFAKQNQKLTLEKNAVYIVSEKGEKEMLEKELNIERFIGVVIEGSNIGKIKFEYSKRRDDLEEGVLLELEVGNRGDGTLKKIYYQVISGVTEKEKLEKRNETGFIEGEAVQLGEWKNNKLSFQKFGWVPTINTPIFTADTSSIHVPVFSYPEYQLGVIPNTTLPSVIDLSQAASHHVALLGVTGSGKSYLARSIIEQLQQDTKIICVDFTGEWKNKLSSLSPVDLIDKSKLPEVEEQIAKKEMEASGRYPDKTKILEYKRVIQKKLDEYVEAFVGSESRIAMFETPELSNTTFIMEFTQMFLESVFNYARQNPGEKICIVLEEAHTVIPETNFLGDLGDYGSSKALVSKMSQIALQGRKYGVGLVVIAQRTANVSKTVLTQCNTVICFQAFDETSFSFLGNYIGKDMVQVLPNLKQYHAVVAGKAVRSNVPMIVDLYKKEE